MEQEQIQEAVEKLEDTEERNFNQSYDLIINLKNVDINTNPIDDYIVLPNSRGKEIKMCGLVDRQLEEEAEEHCEEVIRDNDFDEYKEEPKKTKKVAKKCDFFISQSNLMPDVATAFGRVLGPRNKMPSPEAGCVVQSDADLEELKNRLQKTIHLLAKESQVIQCIVGSEEMDEEEVIENTLSVYNALKSRLPKADQNIDNVYLKKTMSKPVEVQ